MGFLFASVLLVVASVGSFQPHAEALKRIDQEGDFSCQGVIVRPGDAIQEMINAKPRATTFCFRRGIYAIQEALRPKSDDRLIGERGAILTGSNSTPAAILGYGDVQTGVVIKGFVIEHFAGEDEPGRRHAIDSGKRWRIVRNEIRYNGGGGLNVDPGTVVRRNYIHHNGLYGVNAMGADIKLLKNEISFNSTLQKDSPNVDAGASKFIRTSGLVVRGNFVHHNYGAGLWTDGDNIHTLYEGNRIVSNLGSGIHHEISYDAVIRDNVLRNNASTYAGRTVWWGSQIRISSSSNVEIYRNRIKAKSNVNALGIIDFDRGTGAYGPWRAKNIDVYSNIMVLKGGSVGAVDQEADNNVRFRRNTYFLDDINGTYFQWNNDHWTAAEWRSYGNDVHGKFIEP
jgi:hypothetical protein